MKRIIIILVILLIKINTAYCQIEDVLPPSPTASALGKYVDNPVSLYTGTPTIAIPLYEIKMKEVSLPITLTYNPQDIQTETTPSNVGLGWSLNAGGLITRAVKDVPDDFRYDYADEDDNKEIIQPCNPLVYGVDYMPYKRWGYMYAIADGGPVGGRVDYLGTETYNLDLHSIYNNRGNVCPQDAILRRFAYIGLCESCGNFNYLKYFVADLDPDIFYFNFNGYSGKFVFDVETDPQAPRIKIVPYQDLKITYQTNPTTGWLTGFTVIDPKGIEYIFQDIEKSVFYYEDPAYLPEKRTYNSSWWLSQIKTPNGETLNFSYETKELKEFSITESVTSLVHQTKNISYKNKLVWVKQLSSIQNNNIYISFISNHTREDLYASTANALTGIEISSNFPTHHRIKKYTINYDYFLSSTTEYFPSVSSIRFNSVILSNDERASIMSKRLRLKSINEYGLTDNDALPAIEFEYNYYDYNGETSAKFPAKLTYNNDLWGYANGVTGSKSTIPILYVYPDLQQTGDLRMFSVYEKETYSGRSFYWDGSASNEYDRASKQPDSNYTDIGVLTKIIYPTGGSTTYEYKPHKFILDGEEEIGGGLSISTIIKDDEQGNKIYYQYQYTKSESNSLSSGKVVNLPMFATLSISAGLETNSSAEEIARYADAYSNPVNELGRTHGSNVGYTRVVEYKSTSTNSEERNNGYSEYIYSFPAAFGKKDDYPNVPPYFGDCSEEEGYCDGLYQMTKVHNFFMNGQSRPNAELEYYPSTSLSHLLPPNPNYDWNRGHILRKTVYDVEGNPVKNEDYEYELYYPYDQTTPFKVYGIKMADVLPDVNWVDNSYDLSFCMIKGMRVAKYEVLTDVAKLLSNKTETEYYTDGSSISKTTNYKYESSAHRQLTSETFENSNGDVFKTQYRYAPDFQSDIMCNSMRYINDLEPVEIIKYKNGQVINSTITQFTCIDCDFYDIIYWGGPIKPYKVYSLELGQPVTDYQLTSSTYSLDSRHKQQVSYDSYDNLGNPLQVTNKTTGITTCYIWGYEREYPIAKVVNATYSEIESILDSTDLEFLNAGYTFDYDEFNDVKYIEDIYSDEETRNLLTPLRASLPNAQVTTYTYKPLVGMTSETDLNGITTYYEYDNFNRLKTIKDYEGNIVSQYDYHHKNQKP